MFSKKYSLSTKYAFTFGSSGIGLVLASLLRLVFGSTCANVAFVLSIVGMMLAILGTKMHFESEDEMSERHLLLAHYRSLRTVALLLIIFSAAVKILEGTHRFYKFPSSALHLDGDMIFLLLGIINMSLAYYFIQYEKYGEE